MKDRLINIRGIWPSILPSSQGSAISFAIRMTLNPSKVLNLGILRTVGHSLPSAVKRLPLHLFFAQGRCFTMGFATHRGPCTSRRHLCGTTPFGEVRKLSVTSVLYKRDTGLRCAGSTLSLHLSLMIGELFSNYYSGVVVPQPILTRSSLLCSRCLSATHTDFRFGFFQPRKFLDSVDWPNIGHLLTLMMPIVFRTPSSGICVETPSTLL